MAFEQDVAKLLSSLAGLDDEDLSACQEWMAQCVGLLRGRFPADHPWVVQATDYTARHLDPRKSYRSSTPNNRRRALDGCRAILNGALEEGRARSIIVNISGSTIAGNVAIGSVVGDMVSGDVASRDDDPPSGKPIFVSYMREDTARVHQLVASLRLAGFDVWWDQDTLRAGDLWREVIRDVISSGGAFLACLSSTFEKRPESYMHDELAFAAQNYVDTHREQRWMIPVRLDDTPLPLVPIGSGVNALALADLHAVDWFADPTVALASICGALR